MVESFRKGGSIEGPRIYTYTHIHVHVHVHVHIHIFTTEYVYICICIYTDRERDIYIYICVRVYIKRASQKERERAGYRSYGKYVWEAQKTWILCKDCSRGSQGELRKKESQRKGYISATDANL